MKRLSKKQMIIFAIGQLGWSMLSGIIGAWLVTYFLPTQSDMDAGAISYLVPGLLGGFITVLGIITASSRIFDAVSDPLIASGIAAIFMKGIRLPFGFLLLSDNEAINGSVTASKIRLKAVIRPKTVMKPPMINPGTI